MRYPLLVEDLILLLGLHTLELTCRYQVPSLLGSNVATKSWVSAAWRQVGRKRELPLSGLDSGIVGGDEDSVASNLGMSVDSCTDKK